MVGQWEMVLSVEIEIILLDKIDFLVAEDETIWQAKDTFYVYWWLRLIMSFYYVDVKVGREGLL